MLGNKLKQLREARCLTQADIAKGIGVSRERYNQYENNRRAPDYDTLLTLAKSFNVSTDYLLGNADDPTPIRNVNQDLIDDQDVESQWHAFVDEYSKGTSMFLNYENVDDEQKLLIMEEYKEKLEKKKKKVLRFMDFSDEVIDEALIYAAYNEEQRKKKLDD